MKKFFLFFILAINIFAIEKNAGVGLYLQQGRYKSQNTGAYPFIIINYGPYYLNGSEVGYNFTKGNITLTPFLKYDTVKGVEASTLDTPYNLINDRDAPLLLGIKTKKKYKIIDATMTITGDITSHSFAFSIEGSHNFRPFKPLFITPSVSLSYYDSKYADYFYGIDSKESIVSTLRELHPKDGFIYQISMDMLLFFSEKTGLSINTTYEIIDSRWKSDIIEKTSQSRASLIAFYRF
jgi:outer membrane protein